MPTIEFHADPVCPWAYIASQRVEALAASCGAALEWRPVLLGGIYDAIRAPQGKHNSASVLNGPQKGKYERRELFRTARRWNVPLRFHPQHPVRSVKALRFLHSLGPIDRPKMFHALFRAYWIDNLDIADSAVLLGIVNSVFSDRRITSADLEEIVSNNETYKNALRDATDLIVSRGAVGVPDCFVPDDRFPGGGRMFWGGDRFHFVAGAVAEARVPGSLVPISSPQQTVLPRTPLSKPTHLDFYFDLASPWAYLAFTQLPRLLAEAGPLLTITLKPVSLATVFKKIGAPAAPSDAKRALQAADLQSWVSYWSHLPYPDGHKEPVDCRVPRKAPRSEHALRLAVAALRSSGMTTPESEAWKTISLLFRAIWADNIDPSDSALRSYLVSNGIPESVLQTASNTASEQVTRNSEELMAAGGFGVPTFRIGDEIVFGQDRIDLVSDVLRGWTPDLEGGAEVLLSGERGKL